MAELAVGAAGGGGVGGGGGRIGRMQADLRVEAEPLSREPPTLQPTQSREGWARRPGAPSGGRAAGPTTGALPKTTLPAAEGTRHAESFRARRSAKDKPGPGGSLDARTGQEPEPRLEATRRSLVLNGPSLGLRRAPRRDSLQIPTARDMSLQTHLVKGTWGQWLSPRRGTPILRLQSMLGLLYSVHLLNWREGAQQLPVTHCGPQ